MIKCPVCDSKKVTYNEEGDRKCQRCGYINKKDEKSKSES